MTMSCDAAVLHAKNLLASVNFPLNKATQAYHWCEHQGAQSKVLRVSYIVCGHHRIVVRPPFFRIILLQLGDAFTITLS